ncbi:MAG TPA: Rid family hydrolase [Chitinispirillaceae bacterium]|nr:Rid family hydrolase [Chitinispirillaceae bacterium]
MKKVTYCRLSRFSTYSSFSTEDGCEEFYLALGSPEGSTFVSALEIIEREYIDALKIIGLNDSTTVFGRLFLSDYVNQNGCIETSELLKKLRTGVLSIIEEKPIGGGPVALFSHHIRNPGFKVVSSSVRHAGVNDPGCTGLFQGENYSLLYTANYCNGEVFDAYRQTDVIFKNINAVIDRNGMKLLDNTIRTWIYVRDIDNHYQNMVRARREYFTDHGLTNDTRYLASTGIEGGGRLPEHLVTVDSLSISNLVPGQIVRMEAVSHMSPTILYGVTFERGLRVRFGDRSHMFISGTASIDNKGVVLHLCDAVGQAKRAVENLRALLEEQQAAFSDLAYLICYVRNFHEWHLIEDVLRSEIGSDVPVIPVAAKVCRPTWLFELEGVAVTADNNQFAPFK